MTDDRKFEPAHQLSEESPLIILHRTQYLEWFAINKEEVLNSKSFDPLAVYLAEKVLSEQAVWEFADQHPDLEITTSRFTPEHACRTC